MLGANPGLSQKELSELFGVFPSRPRACYWIMLEKQDLIERRDDPEDRRGYRLHLTPAGQKTLADIGRMTRDLEKDLCAALTDVGAGED